MPYRIGDAVFLSNGQPAIVSGRDERKGTSILDRDVDVIRKEIRHGYKNGVEPERREELLSILDEVKKLEKAEDRVNELQKRIEELSAEPTKNLQFIRYLEAERSHLMNISGYRPRFYSTEDHKLR